MRIFFHETKLITIVAIFAAVVAIGLDLACSFPFKSIISNVCYSIIAAYIFYLIQVYFPERRKRRLLATRIRGYILGRILDNLNFITSIIDKNNRDTLVEDDVNFIIESAVEAYNNLFKCIDDFGQVIDEEILDVIVALSENQFIYDLYYLRHGLFESCSSQDTIYDSYEEYGKDFKKLKDRLGQLAIKLPFYDRELSDDIKEKVKFPK